MKSRPYFNVVYSIVFLISMLSIQSLLTSGNVYALKNNSQGADMTKLECKLIGGTIVDGFDTIYCCTESNTPNQICSRCTDCTIGDVIKFKAPTNPVKPKKPGRVKPKNVPKLQLKAPQ